MAEKNRTPQARPVTDEARAELAARLVAVHISRIREMPRIELYLDQLLTLVSQELEFMCIPGETIVTGSMVNNYVKQGVIPPPHKKRYTRRHVAALVFVCALKRVFSIAQVSQLAAQVWDSGLDLEALYDRSCAALERALAARCAAGEKNVGPAGADGTGEKNAGPAGADGTGSGATQALELVDASGAPAAPDLARLLEAAMDALAAKVFVEQTLLLSVDGR